MLGFRKTLREMSPQDIIASFRRMTFDVAYHHLYADERDCTTRFFRALLYSVQPIRNRKLVDAWWEWTAGRSMAFVLEQGVEPPAILRPMVDAWRSAVARAEAFEDEQPTYLDGIGRRRKVRGWAS